MAVDESAEVTDAISIQSEKDIAKTPGQQRKRGRPTIVEKNGDLNISSKVVTLRNQGRSWSKIADELGISRTTARRLCQKPQELCQKSEPVGTNDRYLPEKINQNQDDDDWLEEDEIFEHLPLLYQKFIRLMREVRDEGNYKQL